MRCVWGVEGKRLTVAAYQELKVQPRLWDVPQEEVLDQAGHWWIVAKVGSSWVELRRASAAVDVAVARGEGVPYQ